MAEIIELAAHRQARGLPPSKVELPLVGKFNTGDRIVEAATGRTGAVLQVFRAMPGQPDRYLVHFDGTAANTMRLPHQIAHLPTKPCA